MEFSDAILKGCELRPNSCRNSWFHVQSVAPFSMASCVMAAAYEGAFGPIQTTINFNENRATLYVGANQIVRELRERFPVLDLEVLRIRHIKSTDYVRKVAEHIMWLNDDCGWTREQIAAWMKYVVEGSPMIPEEN